MSSSPSLTTGNKLEPPPNLLSLEYDHDEIVEFPQLILLGDSITQFSTLTLQAYLQTLFIRRLDVINRGFSGFTAPMGLKALSKFLPRDAPQSFRPSIRLITIFYGANDACVPGEAQHVELSRYTKAVKDLVNYPGFRRDDTKTEIVLITPPPVNEHQFSKEPSGYYLRRAGRTSQYAQALCQIGGFEGVHVLDYWSILMRKVGWTASMGRDCCCEHLSSVSTARSSYTSPVEHIPGCCHCSVKMPGADFQLSDFLADGIHLTKLGYDILFDALVSLIRKDIPLCAPENLPFILPEWRSAISWSAR